MRPELDRNPASASTSSIWPLPSTPAIASTSPACTSKLTSLTRCVPLASTTVSRCTERSGAPGLCSARLSGSVTSRPTIMRASSARVASATGRQPASRPSRRTITSSQISNTSPSLWEMKIVPFPSAFRRRMTVSRPSISGGLRFEVGSSRMSSSAPRRIAFRISNSLPAAERKVADERFRVEVEPVAPAGLAYLAGDLRCRQPAAGPLPTEHDVLGDRHRLDQHELLVDHADAERDRLLRVVAGKLGAAKNDAARIGPHHSEQHLHQRGLARAVLPEQDRESARPPRRDRCRHWRAPPQSTSRCPSSPGAGIRPWRAEEPANAYLPPRASSRVGTTFSSPEAKRFAVASSSSITA